MANLTITLLGAMQVARDGVAVHFEADAARALLVYLAVNAGRPVPRELLAGLFWPEVSDTDALRNLRVALYRLRNAIHDRRADPPYLLASRATLQLNLTSDVWSDVSTFVEHLRALKPHTHSGPLCSDCVEHLMAATELYRGDFLQGFSYPSSEFEAWVVTWRESLHVQMLEALDLLADYDAQRGAHAEALMHARRQIELEPWRENAYRQAMRALASSGQRPAALAQYEACARILDVELGIEPEAATRALHQQILHGEFAPSVTPMPTPPVHPPSPQGQRVTTDLPDEAVISGFEAELPDRSPPPLTETAPPASGERRTANLLIAQVHGAEQLLTSVGLELWAEALHEVLESLHAVVARYGGTALQIQDPRLVAAFGAAVVHEDDTERAVLAALGMAEAFAAARERMPAESGADALALSVGVMTGDAVIYARDSGDVAVHAAVLAEVDDLVAQVPAGTLWVTEATWQRVEGRFEWAWLGEVRSSERGAVRLFRPLAPVTAPTERDVGGLRAPLVGRAAELQALMGAVARVGAGVGGIVTVMGEPGIGKSRLVAEARSRISGRQLATGDQEGRDEGDEAGVATNAIRWVEGHWLSYTTTTAYYGWQQLLRRLLELSDACTRTACTALDEQIATLCPERSKSVMPYLARLLALPVDAGTAAMLDSLVEAGLLQGAIFRAVTDLLRCVALQTPLVLVLEDVHWADEASLALLEHLLALTDQLPLLLLVVLRPVRTHGCWRVRESIMRDYSHRHIDIWLAPLTADDSGALIQHLLAAGGRDDVAGPDLAIHVQHRAEGNPFFTAEIIRSLLDRGVVSDALPETVHDVLMARIAGLPLAARQVLQLAAVVGRSFRYRVLADITVGEDSGSGCEELGAALLQLLHAQMIHEHAWASGQAPGLMPDREYSFEHELTLEAAYGSLLERKRRLLHRRVAEAWERLYPEQVEAQLGLLAHHWVQAGDKNRAAAYLQRAGEQAAAQYANDEAIAYFTRALSLVSEEDLNDRYALLLARERVYYLQGNCDAAAQDLDLLQTLAEQLSSLRNQAEVALRRARRSLRMDDPKATVKDAKMAVQIATRLGDSRIEALGLLYEGQGMSDRAMLAGGMDLLRRAAETARAAGARDVEALALREYGLALAWAGRNEQAGAVLERSLAVYRATGDLVGEANVLDALALRSLYAGDYDRALDLVHRGVALQREVGNRFDEGYGLHTLAWTSCLLGRYAEAEAAALASRALLEAVRTPSGAAAALTIRGKLLTDLGAYDEARSVYQDVFDIMPGDVDAFPVLQAWAGLALVHYLLGEGEAAITYSTRLLTAVDAAKDRRAWYPFLRVWAWVVMGHTNLGQGELGVAQGFYHKAQRLADDPDTFIAIRPNLILDLGAGLAALALAKDDLTEALAHVQRIVDPLLLGAIDGVLEPMRIFLTCYRVLDAARDSRAAKVLGAGYRTLMQRADTIDNEALRHSYLENVVANRQIVSAHRESQLTR